LPGDNAYFASTTLLPYGDTDELTMYFTVSDSRDRVFVFSAMGGALLEL
jgi:hypothetical protein